MDGRDGSEESVNPIVGGVFIGWIGILVSKPGE
jgi:hypothetical protein